MPSAPQGRDELLVVDVEPAPLLEVGPPACPVDRLPRRRRNQICIAIIGLGLLNFFAYTLSYAAVGGDAVNGSVEQIRAPDGVVRPAYIVRGHFIQNLQGRQREVSRAMWMYSYIHSITVPLTSAALVISMLVLARPHILATMRDGFVSGATFVTVVGTVVIVGTLFVVSLFVWQLVQELGGA